MCYIGLQDCADQVSKWASEPSERASQRKGQREEPDQSHRRLFC